jgi:hypothetical protein
VPATGILVVPMLVFGGEIGVAQAAAIEPMKGHE